MCVWGVFFLRLFPYLFSHSHVIAYMYVDTPCTLAARLQKHDTSADIEKLVQAGGDATAVKALVAKLAADREQV